MPSPVEAERGIRRVVTTHDSSGKAVILCDGIAANARVRESTGVRSTLLWTTDATPARYANDDRGTVQIGVLPPPGGSILRIVEFPPQGDAPPASTHGEVAAEMGLGAKAGGRMPPRHPFMHATDSVDYALVLEGEIDMLLDDSEVHLRAGDVLVQQGTNHAWVNRGDRPCRIAFVLIDAAPR